MPDAKADVGPESHATNSIHLGRIVSENASTMLSRGAFSSNSMLDVSPLLGYSVHCNVLWGDGNKGFVMSRHLHMACVAISS